MSNLKERLERPGNIMEEHQSLTWRSWQWTESRGEDAMRRNAQDGL